MKKILTFTLALVLALTFVGCKLSLPETQSPPSPAGQPGNSTTAPGTSSDGSGDKNIQNGSGDQGGVQWAEMTKGWPGQLAPELPEYPGGNEKSYSQYADGTINIGVADAGRDGFDAYLWTLEEEGWHVEDEVYGTTRAVKGAYTANMQLMGDINLWIELTIAEESDWPSLNEYPINLPKPDGYTVIDASVDYDPDLEFEYYLFCFTCVDMDGEAAERYLSSLPQSWEWEGKTYVWQSDDYYADGANMIFVLSVYPEDE